MNNIDYRYSEAFTQLWHAIDLVKLNKRGAKEAVKSRQTNPYRRGTSVRCLVFYTGADVTFVP